MKQPCAMQHPRVMMLGHKMLAALAVLAVLAIFSALPTPLDAAGQHAGGCPAHHHHTPAPTPSSHNCCQAGHQSAIIQAPASARDFGASFGHFSDFAAAEISRPYSAPLLNQALPGDPPATTPLRI